MYNFDKAESVTMKTNEPLVNAWLRIKAEYKMGVRNEFVANIQWYMMGECNSHRIRRFNNGKT